MGHLVQSHLSRTIISHYVAVSFWFVWTSLICLFSSHGIYKMRISLSSIENMLYLFRNADSLLPKISFGLAKGVSRVNERGHQTQRREEGQWASQTQVWEWWSILWKRCRPRTWLEGTTEVWMWSTGWHISLVKTSCWLMFCKFCQLVGRFSNCPGKMTEPSQQQVFINEMCHPVSIYHKIYCAGRVNWMKFQIWAPKFRRMRISETSFCPPEFSPKLTDCWWPVTGFHRPRHRPMFSRR